MSIRHYQHSDAPFVYNAWLRSNRNSDFARFIPNDLYYSTHSKIIEKHILNSTILVSCDDINTEVIRGFACFSGTTVHYVYVKQVFRMLGVAKGLLAEVDIKGVTHWSPAITNIFPESKRPIYNPYELTK